MSDPEIGETDVVDEVEEPVEDEDEIVEDMRTKETFRIPSDVSTTGLKDKEGKPIPDRVATILINNYVNYPKYVGSFEKKGELQTIMDVTKKNKAGKIVKGSDTRIMEIQKYVKVDDETGKERTIKIRKSIQKKYYPVIQKLREISAKTNVTPNLSNIPEQEPKQK